MPALPIHPASQLLPLIANSFGDEGQEFQLAKVVGALKEASARCIARHSLPAAAFSKDIDDLCQPLAAVLPVDAECTFQPVRVAVDQRRNNLPVLSD